LNENYYKTGKGINVKRSLMILSGDFDGSIPSAAVFQAQRGISKLVKPQLLGDPSRG
jgi:hypothetical protein